MPSFQYVKPTDEQVALMQTYRDKYEALFTELENLGSSGYLGRGLSLAKTHLEESAMWLNKAITRND